MNRLASMARSWRPHAQAAALRQSQAIASCLAVVALSRPAASSRVATTAATAAAVALTSVIATIATTITSQIPATTAIPTIAAVLAASPARAEDSLGHRRPKGVDLAPLFELVTHRGAPLERAALRGRPFVIAFGYTHCPDVCPTTLLDLTNHLSALGPDADRITVFFLTVDPERDTPAHLAAYLASFDPRIVGLTGSELQVAAAAHALDAYYERGPPGDKGTYIVDHTLKVAFFDRYGLLATRLDLVRASYERVRTLLGRLLAQ